MSIHPSLGSKNKGKRHRSVLKRFERLKEMLEKEKWKEGNSVFGLPKLKSLRWKLKKTKKTAEAEAAAEEGTVEATAQGTPAKEKGSAAGKKERKSEKK